MGWFPLTVPNPSLMAYLINSNKCFQFRANNRNLHVCYVCWSSKNTFNNHGINNKSFKYFWTLKAPDGLTLDTLNRRLFWTDTGTNMIEMANLDGSGRQVIIAENLDEPRAIVADKEEGWVGHIIFFLIFVSIVNNKSSFRVECPV